jgi:hypothetical protein
MQIKELFFQRFKYAPLTFQHAGELTAFAFEGIEFLPECFPLLECLPGLRLAGIPEKEPPEVIPEAI